MARAARPHGIGPMERLHLFVFISLPESWQPSALRTAADDYVRVPATPRDGASPMTGRPCVALMQGTPGGGRPGGQSGMADSEALRQEDSASRRTARTAVQQAGEGRAPLLRNGRVRRSRQRQDDEGQRRGQHRVMAHQRAIAADITIRRHARAFWHARVIRHAGVPMGKVPGRFAGHRRDGGVIGRPGVEDAGDRWRKQQQAQGDRGQPNDETTLSALADQVISNWIEPWIQVQASCHVPF